jgi:undecaprenyl-diphosphatase
LHAGSAVGLALALRDDVRALDPAQVRRLALSSVPAALAGLVLGDLVERRLGKPGPTAVLLAGAGLALLVADRQADSPQPAPASRDHRKDHRTPVGESFRRPPALLGAAAAQVVALAPGVSRTGATLTALRAQGVDRDEALRTSLLMSLPVTLGAAGLTAVRGRQLPPAVPTAVAGLTAYAAARRVRATKSVVTGSVLYRLAVAATVAVRLRRERS